MSCRRILLVAILSCAVGTAARQADAAEQAGAASGRGGRGAAGPGRNPPPRRPRARERAAARRAERATALQTRRDEEHRKWLARVEAYGVEPWPEESDEDHAAALARSRQMVEEVISLLPGTQLYETEHFLFTSNMPPAEVAPFVRYLDRMYEWMCELYGVKNDTRIWLWDKAPIFPFLTPDTFQAF